MQGADTTSRFAWLAAALGSAVVDLQPARWGTTHRTLLVTLADGRRVAVRDAEGRRGLTTGTTDPRLATRLLASGVPLPSELLMPEASARGLSVTEYVDGIPGPQLLADPTDAIALGTEMGRLTGRLWSVPIGDLDLPRARGEAPTLEAAMRAWTRHASGNLPPGAVRELERLTAAIPSAFAGRRAVLAHGDWVPANVVVRDRAVVAVFDWDDARTADPLLDVAWWGWVVGYHHPERFAAAWPAFLETAGVELDPPTVERIRILAVARLLEHVAAARDDATRAGWLERLTWTLDTDA